ncbi:uncharacterized protein UV8b_07229 [Ustilaginoidea virens]|uniref:Uncharacterized protein n=1 Tax=Ustilaginoidea virens TaxID=1159556 RepID=A0A8E5HX78_USTVR|nr:uncharacterized protein UV8b_07229 [Ustilaginoidea virens]QUC22988.1 hypothetical protein UV8b_07229 [Ustilaginoidea virens]
MLPLWFVLAGICVGAAFVRPPPYSPDHRNKYQDNPRYTCGRSVKFKWQTDYKGPMVLAMLTEYPGTVVQAVLKENIPQGTTEATWTANLHGVESILPPGHDAVLYLALSRGDQPQPDFYSSYFNVTAPNAAAASASASPAPATTAPPSDTATATATATVTATPTATPTGKPRKWDGRSNLTRFAVAGVVVGAVIGGVLVLARVAFVLWTRRKKRAGGDGPTELAAGTCHGLVASGGRDAHRRDVQDIHRQESKELDSESLHEMP